MTYTDDHPFSPNYKPQLKDTDSDKRARPWHVRRAMGKKVPDTVAPSINEPGFKKKPAKDHPIRVASTAQAMKKGVKK